MHLVIVSTPRAGAHMLRSMLAADTSVSDIGAFLSPGEERIIKRPTVYSVDAVRQVYERETGRRKGKLVLSHLKLMHEPWDAVRAAASTGGRFILLTRRDRLAQACSLLLALKCGKLTGPMVETITPDPAMVEQLQARFAKIEKLARLHLEGLPHVELAFEDIRVSTVTEAVASLGLDLKVGEPTTIKSSPRLADYVTNLSELI